MENNAFDRLALPSVNPVFFSTIPQKDVFSEGPIAKARNGRRKWVQSVYIYRQRYFTNDFLRLVPLQGLKWVKKKIWEI